MALLHLSLDDIREDDLRALIGNGARESLYIDYKRQIYGRNDAYDGYLPRHPNA